MRVAAVGDNCVDVYYTLNRFYPTGNAVDFAINLKKLGQDVSLVSIQGDDVFGVSVENVLKKYGGDLTHFYKGGRQTAAAQMNIINGDRIHEKFDKNVLADFTLDRERLDFVKQFDLVYSEKWSRIGRYIKDIKNGNNIMIHDFSKRLADPGNEEILPYLDYAFFSYEKLDETIKDFLKSTQKKTGRIVIAMLGGDGSLAYDGSRYYREPAKQVEIVNTVGAGDAYVAGFTKGLCEGLGLPECMHRGKETATKIIRMFDPY